MTSHPQYVLCVGRDQTLLETRRQVLKRAGYRTLTTADGSVVAQWLLSEKRGILVLCHTLTENEMDVIMQFHHEIHSTVSVLCLCAGQRKPVMSTGHIYDVFDGPAAFLTAVARISSQSHLSA